MKAILKRSVLAVWMVSLLTGTACAGLSPDRRFPSQQEGNNDTGQPAPGAAIDEVMGRPHHEEVEVVSVAKADFPKADAQAQIQVRSSKHGAQSIKEFARPSKGMNKQDPRGDTPAGKPKGKEFGVFALIFALFGIAAMFFVPLLGLALGVLAIIFGAIGMSGDRSGKGLAIAGMVLGILTIVLPLMFLMLILSVFF